VVSTAGRAVCPTPSAGGRGGGEKRIHLKAAFKSILSAERGAAVPARSSHVFREGSGEHPSPPAPGTLHKMAPVLNDARFLQ